MGKISKTFTLTLILALIIPSICRFTAKPTFAQTWGIIGNPSYPTPLTPEFSAIVTNSSYNTPPTYTYYSYDPDTGTFVNNQSYYNGYIDALNLTITIINQPLAQSFASNVSLGFKYLIEVKPYNSTNWASLTGFRDGLGDPEDGFGFLSSNGSSTSLTFQFSNPYISSNYSYPVNSGALTYVPTPFFPVTVAKNQPLDIRVRAEIGNFFYISMGQLDFNGNHSDWNQLTITMANGEASNATPIPTQATTPTVPEFSVLLVGPLLLSLFSVAVILRYQKTAHPTPC